MSKKIEYVLELTEEELLALVAVLGPTHGRVGYDIYSTLWQAHSGDHSVTYGAAAARFPDPQALDKEDR